MSALDGEVQIHAIIYPEHLNSTSRGCIITAAMTRFPNIVSPLEIFRHANAAHLAYGLESSQNLSLDTEPDIGEDPRYLLLIDDNRPAFMGFSFAYVEDWGFSIRGRMTVGDVPDQASRQARALRGARFTNFVRIVQYHASVEDALADSVTGLRERGDSVDGPIQSEDFLRVIVVTGEASPSDIDQTREMVARVVPDHEALIRPPMDPGFAGAVGAAKRAKKLVHKPGILEEIHYYVTPAQRKGWTEPRDGL